MVKNKAVEPKKKKKKVLNKKQLFDFQGRQEDIFFSPEAKI